MAYQIQPVLTYEHHGDLCFSCNNNTQEIEAENGKIRLRSKLWRVFTLLVSNSERMIERDFFIEQVWSGNYFTGPAGLNHTICHLRHVIEKLKLPIEIITIPKKGYRLQPKTDDGKPIYHNMASPSHSLYSLRS